MKFQVYYQGSIECEFHFNILNDGRYFYIDKANRIGLIELEKIIERIRHIGLGICDDCKGIVKQNTLLDGKCNMCVPDSELEF